MECKQSVLAQFAFRRCRARIPNSAGLTFLFFFHVFLCVEPCFCVFYAVFQIKSRQQSEARRKVKDGGGVDHGVKFFCGWICLDLPGFGWIFDRPTGQIR